MMGAVHIPDDVQGKVVIEAIKCATMLDGLMIVEMAGKEATRGEHVYGANPK